MLLSSCGDRIISKRLPMRGYRRKSSLAVSVSIASLWLLTLSLIGLSSEVLEYSLPWSCFRIVDWCLWDTMRGDCIYLKKYRRKLAKGRMGTWRLMTKVFFSISITYQANMVLYSNSSYRISLASSNLRNGLINIYK